jgi:outer membrane protein assembly factor BamB
LKRAVLAVVLVALLAVGGLAAWRYFDSGAKEVRGSSTEEFVVTAPPAKPRPPKALAARPWPTYGYDVQRTRVAAQFDVGPPFRKLWTVRSGNLLEYPPVVANGRVFVSHQRGRVFAIDAKTGKVQWSHRFPRCSASSPTVSGTVVYVTLMQPWPCSRSRDQRGEVVALRARDGKILWRLATGVVESSPLLIGDLLYFGSWDHRLYALDVNTRKVRWSFEADDELNSSPAYAGGNVYIGSDGGSVYAVKAKTGRLLWRAQSYASFGGRREYFYATPAVAYGRVYIGNTDGTMYAFGASTGNLLWSKRAGTYVYTGAAVWRRTVYVGSYDGNVYAFDAATGDLKWTYEAPASIHGAPSIVDGLIYFATCGTCGHQGSRYAKQGPRLTFALDARTGKRVWTFPDGQYSPVIADSKRLYVTGRAWVYALEPRARAQARRQAPPPARSRSAARSGTRSGTHGR